MESFPPQLMRGKVRYGSTTGISQSASQEIKVVAEVKCVPYMWRSILNSMQKW